jgi:excisionase family DNA binding protein
MMIKINSKLADADSTLLTVQDVAELDRCSVKTVRRAIKAGLLQALNVGPGERLLRVSKGSHAAYRKAQRL